jgi:hypothetical protein
MCRYVRVSSMGSRLNWGGVYLVSQGQLARSMVAIEQGFGSLIVMPSMTFDAAELAKIPGAVHFEERMLWLLQTLRNPQARVVYVTSESLRTELVDYSLSLVGIAEARERLELISCDDSRAVALTVKVLERPDVQRRIRNAVESSSEAVMMCHVATESEEQLASALGVSLFACDPSLADLGTKSASREIFREAEVPFPNGSEHLRDRDEVVAALLALKRHNPQIRKAVVKLNDSFAGGGNALFTFAATDSGGDVTVSRQLENLDFVANDETPDRYFSALERMGGVVEEFVEGNNKTSPSAQCIIAPDGSVRVAATHEQILGGVSNQTYFGCRFPADKAYAPSIGLAAQRIAAILGSRGVTGHISIDFVCVKGSQRWDHSAIEVNLRMGGATAPISFLEAVTGNRYDPETGIFLDTQGRSLAYTSADRIQSDDYKKLDIGILLEAASNDGLLFDAESGQGSVLYMLGALRTVGKLGMVAIDQDTEAADARYQQTLDAIDGYASRT